MVINGDTVNSVDARELHAFLGSKQEFANWVKNKVINNPFFESGTDFVHLDKSVMAQPRTSQPLSANRKDYALTQDTAKKVAMAEQTVRGNEARDYFLKCERDAKASATQQNLLPEEVGVRALKASMEIAEFFGLSGNQALISANTAVKKLHGVDYMEVVGVTHLISENQTQYFTPTVIGKPHGLTAAKVNKALEAAGFQTCLRDHKNRIIWCVTDEGKKHCQLLDTGKEHSSGTPIMQIKWAMSALDGIV